MLMKSNCYLPACCIYVPGISVHIQVGELLNIFSMTFFYKQLNLQSTFYKQLKHKALKNSDLFLPTSVKLYWCLKCFVSYRYN